MRGCNDTASGFVCSLGQIIGGWGLWETHVFAFLAGCGGASTVRKGKAAYFRMLSNLRWFANCSRYDEGTT
jgi:hypothetical protein